MRRFGEPVISGQRYRPRPGAYALLLAGRDLLLTEASEPWRELQLPGGGIDAGESPVRALHREVLEETGWRIAAPRRLGAFQRFSFLPEYDLWARKVCQIYLARPVRRLGPPRERHHRALWMPLAEAVQALSVEGDRWFAARLLALTAGGVAAR
jgi:8-oxo-dGTP diphosphatase